MKTVSVLSTYLAFLTLTNATREAPFPPTWAARIHRAIPVSFPTNTSVFVQTTDGDVFFGHLRYTGDHGMLEWVVITDSRADEVDNLLVQMPNGDDLWADIRKLERRIDMNDELPLQPRCFIVYRKTRILFASLRPYIRYYPNRPSVPRVIVRMPETLFRYTGEFERFYGRPPQWLE